MKRIMAWLIMGALGATSACASRAATETKPYAVLHSFNGTDGEAPNVDLIDIGGLLYGTTTSGGGRGFGTVFSLDRTTKRETVIYSFCEESNCPDGANPSGIIGLNGTLYGTTVTGGKMGFGTLFSLEPTSGTEAVLYSFLGGKDDGAFPIGGPIAVKGTIYGTTTAGGGGACESGGCGVAFAFAPGSGTETVLCSFDTVIGILPSARLFRMNGLLYGTAVSGGNGGGSGTVFSLDRIKGTETTLHVFETAKGDGATPYAELVADASGTLYGTTDFGGSGDSGTVFSVNPATGSETVLYSFCSRKNCADGRYAHAGVVIVNGRLYGTTWQGGDNDMGTVFPVDPNTGAETVLHSFGNGTDGIWPVSRLLNVKGTLYGTTNAGGGGSCHAGQGCGTIFRIKP